MYCLQCFRPEKILNNHKENHIVTNGKQAVKMPEKEATVEFKNYHKQ